jgi:hypothetical protein
MNLIPLQEELAAFSYRNSLPNHFHFKIPRCLLVEFVKIQHAHVARLAAHSRILSFALATVLGTGVFSHGSDQRTRFARSPNSRYPGISGHDICSDQIQKRKSTAITWGPASGASHGGQKKPLDPTKSEID